MFRLPRYFNLRLIISIAGFRILTVTFMLADLPGLPYNIF